MHRTAPRRSSGCAGKIYVAEQGANAIVTFTADDAPATPTIAVAGPVAVAVDAHGKTYVATGNAIKTYTPTGDPATPTITTGMNRPAGVAVDAAGKIYVVNDGDGSLRTYAPDGTPAQPTIAGLDLPGGVAIGADGTIVVTNQLNGVISSYAANGTLTGVSINLPCARDCFASAGPVGIALDATERMYVASSTGDAFFTYSALGAPGPPTFPSPVLRPSGVAVARNGTIDVANTLVRDSRTATSPPSRTRA